MANLPDALITGRSQRALDSGKLFDQESVIAIHGRIRPSPLKTCYRLPCFIRSVSAMPDQVCSMSKARAMMSGDTMKEYGLTGGVGEQVGGKRHLLGGGS
jgi:hypothetical protein